MDIGATTNGGGKNTNGIGKTKGEGKRATRTVATVAARSGVTPGGARSSNSRPAGSHRESRGECNR